MWFGSIIPEAFFALALAHFLALLSPGQDFFLIVAHSIRHGLAGSRFICLGVALGNAVYIAIAIVGWTAIRDSGLLFSIVEVLGAAYLIWIGSALLKSKAMPGLPLSPASQTGSSPSSLLPGEAPSLPMLRQLILGMNSALLNPKNALFYMSLMTVILGSEVTLAQQMFCGVWMFAAVLLWDLCIASAIGLKRVQAYLKCYIHRIEQGAGLVLIGMGLYLLGF